MFILCWYNAGRINTKCSWCFRYLNCLDSLTTKWDTVTCVFYRVEVWNQLTTEQQETYNLILHWEHTTETTIITITSHLLTIANSGCIRWLIPVNSWVSSSHNHLRLPQSSRHKTSPLDNIYMFPLSEIIWQQVTTLFLSNYEQSQLYLILVMINWQLILTLKW